MNIVKFKKDKSNTYKVYFDDDTVISLYDDVIVKYNLLVNKEFDIKKFNEITDYNTFLNGYYKSIKYINKKLRSELEIDKYLIKLDVNKKDRESIIKLLYKDGYLNNNNYIKSFINDKYNLSNDGPLKVEKELNKLGFKTDNFYDYLYSLDWFSRIDKLIDKKIKLNHNLSNNNLKLKIVTDLNRLGYLKDEIISVLDNKTLIDDKEILRKELNKIKNRYCKKYNDNELEYRIINYLYKKGFDIESIKEVYREN